MCQMLAGNAQTLNECINLMCTNKYNDALAMADKIAPNQGKPNEALLLKVLIYSELDQKDKAFTAFRDFLKTCDSPDAYIYALHPQVFFNTEDDQVYDLFKKTLSKPNLNEALKPLLREAMFSNLKQQGDFKSATELFTATNELKHWNIVGEFDNTSGGGFNTDFGALAHPEMSYTFLNKKGAKVKWFPITKCRLDRWYDMEYHFIVNNALVYAQTFVESDKEQEVDLKIGLSGSLKVWVNDFMVATEEEERNTNADFYTYRIRLNKGYNRILLQVGNSEIESNNFLVRIADVNGQILSLKDDNVPHEYSKAQAYPVKKTPLFAESFFERRLKKHEGNEFLNQILLFETYVLNWHIDPAHPVVKALKKQYPLSTYISLKARRLYGIDKNSIALGTEKEIILANDPNSTFAILTNFNDAFQREQWDSAMMFINRYVELYGDNADMADNRMAIYRKKNEKEKYFAELNKAYDQYPTNYSIVLEKYYTTLNGSQNVRAANEILRKYTKEVWDARAKSTMIDNYLKLGDKETPKKLYNELLESAPVAVGWYKDYADFMYDIRDFNAALNYIDKAIEISPYVGQYHYLKSQILQSLNRKADAVTELKACIVYNPTDFVARKMLADATKQPDLRQNFPENDISKIIAEARNDAKLYENETLVCLLMDKNLIVYAENGAQESHDELLLMANSKEGLEHLKEMTFPVNRNNQRLIFEKAEIIKKDGSKVPAERNYNQVVFSTIEVGDIVHVSYKIETSYSGRLAEHFWETNTFEFTFPTKYSRYSLMLPAEKKFEYRLMNGSIEPTIKTINDFKLYTWERKDISKIIPEQGMSGDSRNELIISSLPDWNYIANWYSEVSYPKTKADMELKEKVKELLNGHESESNFDKARILYNFIEETCHYSNVPFLHGPLIPQHCTRTMNARLGDCKDLAVLFVAMCREAGLDANLALVQTNGNTKNEFVLPTLSFNHCIALFRDNGREYPVELTSDALSFTSFPATLIGANALSIPKDGTTTKEAELIKLKSPYAPINGNFRTSTVSIERNDVKVQRTALKTGSPAADFRLSYRDRTLDEQRKAIVESVNKEFSKTVTQGDYKSSDLKPLGDTVLVEYSFTVNNLVSNIAGLSVIKLPWTDKSDFSSLISVADRKYNVDYWGLMFLEQTEEKMVINIPKGKKTAEKPVDVHLLCPLLKYDLTYTVTDDKVYATRTVKHLKGNISVTEYEQTRNTLKDMMDADEKELAFK